MIWSSGKPSLLVASRELDVEKRDEGLYIVVSFDLEVKWTAERNVLLFAGLEVELFKEAVVGDHGVPVDSFNKWFSQRKVFDARHPKPIHIVPVVELLLLVEPVLYGAHIERCSVRKHQSPLHQPFVPGEQYRFQHVAIIQAVSHPLGYDNVNLGHGQLDLLDFSSDNLDNMIQLVVSHNS